jgi:putative peptide zinc metalloprotease protein
VAAFPKGEALPTEEDPVLAMVLVPSETEPEATDGSVDDDVWVFPFDKPLPPEEGDNQALAVATEDGSVVYDLAFAMVWAEDDQVLNVNEAHAYASCSDCVAVAVAFQVVLIMDDAQVVVPQNLAVAANYDCYECITAAIASQLVLTVSGEPGEEQQRGLREVWDRLITVAQDITSYSLSEIAARLDSVKSEIVAILDQAPPLQPTPGPSGSTTLTPSPDPTPSTSGSSPPAEEPASPSAPPSTQEETPSSPSPTEQPSPSEQSSPTEQSSPAPAEESSSAQEPSPTAADTSTLSTTDSGPTQDSPSPSTSTSP